MLVLALDTAGPNGRGRSRRPAARRRPLRGDGPRHAERLFALLAGVLDEAGVDLGAVDRIAVTVGPGSFTGIRVALAAARGLGLATGRPVVGVGTLEALAASCRNRLTDPFSR